MTKVLMTCSEKFFNAYPQLETGIKNLGIKFTKLLSEEPIPTSRLITHLKDIDIYLVAVENVNKEIIDHAPKLKYILKHGVGVDNINLDYAREKGIIVTNAPGQNSTSVADMIMALTLSSARHLIAGNSIIRAHGWELLIGNELNNKVMGIIGLGAIGKQVIQRAKSFGMRIIAHDIYHDYDFAQKFDINYVSKEEIFKNSDFLVLCVSLNPETLHLVSKETLKIMKKSARIINTSRGQIINEADLVWALNNEVISGAALDVFSSEPPNKALINAKNIILTPHISGSTYEAAENLARIAIQNISKYLNGNKPDFIVNK